jgi:predicted dehydrogenase
LPNFAEAIAGMTDEPFNFRAGYHIQHLVEKIQESSRTKSWLTL